MEEINNKTYALGALAVAIFAVLAAFLAQNSILAFISAFFVMVSVAIWKAGHLIIPFITKQANIIEIHDSYIIPPARDLVFKRVGSKYYATVFLQARISSSVTEMDISSKSMFMEYFERAISSLNCVVKFSVMVCGVDLGEFAQKLKAKRSEIETAQAKLASTKGVSEQADITRLEREVSMINRQLQRLVSGEKPMKVVCTMMTTAVGLSKDEAAHKARAQAKEVRTVVSNALNVDILYLKGEDMLRCFEWEYMLPATVEELEDQVF